MTTRSLLAVVVAAATLGLTGCTPYTGINSLPLPGTEGTGSDSYEVKVQLHNADDLVANTPVFVNDINVGTTTLVALDGWTPTLTVSLKKDVRLPANAVAALAQTSLLGSKHIDLAPPTGESPQGTLEPGMTIKEDRVKQFPETEDLLAGVSVLLNGGGLQHFQTITTELNRALGNGRDTQAREFLTQFDDFTAGLDKQTADITTALHSFDHLGKAYTPRLHDINAGLEQLPRGLDAVNDLEPLLLETLKHVQDSTDGYGEIADMFKSQIDPELAELRSPLKHLGDVQSGSIPRALRQIPFLIFPLDSIQYLVRGDYTNLYTPVNLTLDSLDKNLFTGTPASGSLASTAEAMRGTSRRGPNNPAGSNPLPPLPLNGRQGLTPPHTGSGPLPGGLPKIGN